MVFGNERTFEKVSQDEIQDEGTLKLIIVKVKVQLNSNYRIVYGLSYERNEK